MCIAIIKSIGIKRPSWDTLKTCFTSNPDGAGYAHSPNGKYFIIQKGFATYESFKASIVALESAKGADYFEKVPAFFHFRIGTHGSKDSPEHTHPFPLTNSIESMEKLACKTRRIVMHNGVLSGYGTSKYNVTAGKEVSDTMDFIATFLHPLQKILDQKTFYESKEAQLLVSKQIGSSRVVVMEPDGKSIRWGDWVEHEGCHYSNSGFKPKPVVEYESGRSYYMGTHSNYDSCHDDYWGSLSSIPVSRVYVDVPIGERNNKDAIDAAMKRRFLYPVAMNGYTNISGKSYALDEKNWYYADFTTKRLYKTSSGAYYAEYEDTFKKMWNTPPAEKSQKKGK